MAAATSSARMTIDRGAPIIPRISGNRVRYWWTRTCSRCGPTLALHPIGSLPVSIHNSRAATWCTSASPRRSARCDDWDATVMTGTVPGRAKIHNSEARGAFPGRFVRRAVVYWVLFRVFFHIPTLPAQFSARNLLLTRDLIRRYAHEIHSLRQADT